MTINKNENIEIEASVKTYIPLIVFSFLATCSFSFAFLTALTQGFSGNFFDLIPPLICFSAILIFLQVFLWFFRGKERLEISSDKIIFVRSNGLLTFRRHVLISDINSIIVNPITFSSNSFIDVQRQFIKEMQGAVFFWYNMGRVEFNIKNHYKSFFNGMNNKQASETVLFLSERLKISDKTQEA